MAIKKRISRVIKFYQFFLFSFFLSFFLFTCISGPLQAEDLASCKDKIEKMCKDKAPSCFVQAMEGPLLGEKCKEVLKESSQKILEAAKNDPNGILACKKIFDEKCGALDQGKLLEVYQSAVNMEESKEESKRKKEADKKKLEAFQKKIVKYQSCIKEKAASGSIPEKCKVFIGN